MNDGRTSRTVAESTTDADVRHRDPESENAVPTYDPWVSFYGFLHRYLRRHTVVFAGIGTLGLLVLVRQLYGLAVDSPRWPVLPSWLVGVGAMSLAFGVGYFTVKDASSCRNCDTAFSKERVASKPVWQSLEGSDRDRVYIEETFECQECGNRTTEPYPKLNRKYPRN